jgi:hypothetical protein
MSWRKLDCLHNPFRTKRPKVKRSEHRRVRDREKLYGEAKTGRRREIFERSGGRCEACRVCGKPEDDDVHKFWQPPGGHQFQRCDTPISPVTMQWSHRRHAARKDDALAEGIASCLRCHAILHNAGGKPVPRRYGRRMNKAEAKAYLLGLVCSCRNAKEKDRPFCHQCFSKLSPQLQYEINHAEGSDWLDISTRQRFLQECAAEGLELDDALFLADLEFDESGEPKPGSIYETYRRPQ